MENVVFAVSGVVGTTQVGNASTNAVFEISGVSGEGQTNYVGANIWTKVITSGNGTLY